MADIAAEASERLLDEERLDFFQTHLFHTRRAFATGAETEIAGSDGIALGHEDTAFDGVIQFADVAGPGVREEGLDGALIEAAEGFAVMAGVLAEEVGGEDRDIFTAISHGRQAEFDG